MEDQRIKKAHIHLGLHPEMLAQVREAAKEDGRTVTGWVLRAVSEKLGNKKATR